MLYPTTVAEARTIVILTMRADFYGQCASYPGLRSAISDHQSLIGPLSEDELREVIETPAQIAGGELERGLMELLLSDMEGQAGALPFLGDALFKLWEKRDGRRLTAKAYMEMGRLGGALDAHAEEFFAELEPKEQTLCHQILIDLVHPGEGAADTKKRVAMDDVASIEPARILLKKLADARLVTTTGEPEAAQAELAHEALISGWRRLRKWVNENREKSRLKQRLIDSAREWQENDKGGDFLYRGTQLAFAEESFGSSAQSLPKLAREFLDVSIAQRIREREEARSRQERELELERQRAAEAEKSQRLEAERAQEAEQYAKEQKQAASKFRQLAWILAAVALLAGVAAVFGFWQKGEAERQKADNAKSFSELALQYDHKGDYAKAEPLFRQALQIREKVLGPKHPHTAASLDSLALLYDHKGDYAKAEPLFRRALQIREKVLGPEHGDTAASLDSLALLYDHKGDYAKAEPLFRRALQIREKVHGPKHPDISVSLNNLATLYEHMGAYATAEPLFQQALQIREKCSVQSILRRPLVSITWELSIRIWASTAEPNRSSSELSQQGKRCSGIPPRPLVLTTWGLSMGISPIIPKPNRSSSELSK